MNDARVMIVDDSEVSADAMALFFELEGHTAKVARDGVEGVEIARGFRPTIIFMDLNMPRMDGFEAAREIRAAFPDAPPRLIALTGWNCDEDDPKVREAGFECVLQKPVSPDQIRQLMTAD